MSDAEDQPVRVVLVDDQELVRSGLRRILRRRDGFEIVSECSDGSELPAALEAHDADVVLMDLRMRQVDGITATRRLAADDEAPPVLVLTTFDDDEMLSGALRAGAAGFLLKDSSADDLIRAVRAERKEAAASPSGSLFLSFRGGMQALTDSLARASAAAVTQVHGEAVAVERTRAQPARAQRVVDDADARREDALAALVLQEARAPRDRSAVGRAGEMPDERAGETRIEHDRDAVGLHLARVEPRHRAFARGAPDALRVA